MSGFSSSETGFEDDANAYAVNDFSVSHKHVVPENALLNSTFVSSSGKVYSNNINLDWTRPFLPLSHRNAEIVVSPMTSAGGLVNGMYKVHISTEDGEETSYIFKTNQSSQEALGIFYWYGIVSRSSIFRQSCAADSRLWYRPAGCRMCKRRYDYWPEGQCNLQTRLVLYLPSYADRRYIVDFICCPVLPLP